MFNNIGLREIVIVAIILFFFFGSKKLVEFGRGLGESGKELKKIKKELTETSEDPKREEV